MTLVGGVGYEQHVRLETETFNGLLARLQDPRVGVAQKDLSDAMSLAQQAIQGAKLLTPAIFSI